MTFGMLTKKNTVIPIVNLILSGPFCDVNLYVLVILIAVKNKNHMQKIISSANLVGRIAHYIKLGP